MVTIRGMQIGEADKIRGIDRSEPILSVYAMRDGELVETAAGHECPNWDETQVQELIARFRYELSVGGVAYGAFVGDRLVGFSVLGYRFRGEALDRLHVDLMYVTREYRRQGIGRRLMEALSETAASRGAAYLYISSTETQSAVRFYKSCGSALTSEVDEELFVKEPEDIHMIIKL